MDKAVLIVDDDRTERRLIANALRGIDINFLEAEHDRDALRILSDKSDIIELVILDLDMPVMNGFETLSEIKKSYAGLPVIVLTGSREAEKAIKAVQMGATDFLSKPVENARLDVAVRNALKMALMSQEISRLKRQTKNLTTFLDLTGHDTGLKECVDIGKKACASLLPVLITGETGTGKEIFARAIHGESPRAEMPFIAVNCGAIPEKLVESILFGHEKGAFTGAVNKTSGKFPEANGGSIFLDEIGELPLEAQVKLLRVLQQQEIEPVGSAKTVPVDVRVISATNRDLLREVKEGRFREDLYFRLNVLHVELPPLRARKSDIPLLAGRFIHEFSVKNKTGLKTLSPEAVARLQNHPWAGNVRELENVINRTMALCDEELLAPAHFSFIQDFSGKAPAIHASTEHMINPLGPDGNFKNLKILENEIIALALAHHDRNISQTAKALGIAKSTLYTKLGGLTEQKYIQRQA